jgi:hypothetical protein
MDLKLFYQGSVQFQKKNYNEAEKVNNSSFLQKYFIFPLQLFTKILSETKDIDEEGHILILTERAECYFRMDLFDGKFF